MKTRLLIIIISFSGLWVGCEKQHKKSANFAPIEQFLENRSGGFEMKPINYDSLGIHGKQLNKRFEATFPEVTFLEKNASLSFVPSRFGLPEDWTDASELTIEMDNTTTSTLQFELAVRGGVGVLGTRIVLEPSQQTTASLDLLDLALISKIDKIYQPMFIELTSLNNSNAKIKIDGLSLCFNEDKIRTVMDKYGQRKNTNWEGKVQSDNEFQDHLESEQKEIALKLRTDWDEFGGWEFGPKLEATGFFRTKKVDGKHWFVTPSGKLFWSFGVNGVRPKIINTATTQITGREFLFEEIPPKTGKYAEAWTSEDRASFYSWNALRKYDNFDNWRDTSLKRLDAWGYNTIGNWSDEALLNRAQFPFTFSFRTTLNKELMLSNGIPDVYNPAWEKHIDNVLSEASRFANNPYLLGYFVDNEAGWGNPKLLETMNENSVTRKVWLKFVQKKYSTVTKVNKAWESSFKTWEDVKKLKLDLIAATYQNDKLEFESAFADKYFSTIRKILKKHDPNHLYLGCRFTRVIKPDHVCQAAGKYCDVVTVNVYARTPTEEVMGEWYKKTGKPILIGEHHINLASERQIPARWGAETPEERKIYYNNYIETWAKTPYALGSHWYQYTDQHITGRGSNGENQPVGLVDITDQPHKELIETAKELSGKIYNWHFESGQELLMDNQ